MKNELIINLAMRHIMYLLTRRDARYERNFADLISALIEGGGKISTTGKIYPEQYLLLDSEKIVAGLDSRRIVTFYFGAKV